LLFVGSYVLFVVLYLYSLIINISIETVWIMRHVELYIMVYGLIYTLFVSVWL